VSESALGELITICPELSLDGALRPAREQLRERIGAYWLPDECVLYIGLAGQPLRTRVRQYYKTPLGAAKPHKGGWWLKMLTVLHDLHVHFAATPDFKDAEEDLLRAFGEDVSDASRSALPADEPVMPFANLRDGNWRRRNHGITGANAGASRSRGESSAPASGAASKKQLAATSVALTPRTRASLVTPHRRSQNVTAKDIDAGQVRIPRGATKAILPRGRTDITVLLRGRILTCRWDPRYGPPERSGVIRVGKPAARELLQAGDVLAVSVTSRGIVELRS
jgi:hypothetical protein